MGEISYKKTFMVMFRTLGIVIKRNPWLFIIETILNIFVKVAVFMQLIIFSRIINIIVQNIADSTQITIASLSAPLVRLLLLFIVPPIASVFREYVSDIIKDRMYMDLQILRAESFSRLDIATLESEKFQSKLQRAAEWGIGAVRNMFFFYGSLIGAVASIIFSAGILFGADYRLVILALISIIPVFMINNIFSLKLFQLRYMQTDNTRIANNRLGFFTDVKKLIDVIQNKISNKFISEARNHLEDNQKKVFALNKKKSIYEILSAIVVATTTIIAIYLAVQGVVAGALTIGALTVVYGTYSSFRASVETFFENLGVMKESARYSSEWFDLLDMKSRIVDTVSPKKVEKTHVPRIEFKNVTFSYPESEKKILDNVSFTIEPFSNIAIVGENGAGKSTIIRLLTRVYDPSEGEILVDGIPLRDIALDSWRDCMSVLIQDFVNYNLTAAESIAISRPDDAIDEAYVRQCAILSGANDFIEEFPKKYDQLIWKGFQDGVELSRGQHQRIAVARTIYRNAPVLVFDEPTSAIDALAEERIFEAIETKMKDKSVVLISHRFSTVKNADKILLLEHGQIEEQGTHAGLMDKDGKYAKLYSMQADRYKDNE